MDAWKKYIRYLRKSHKHVQRVHAGVFAGGITLFFAVIILYSQYGFWHDRYSRQEESVATSAMQNTESPSMLFSHFLEEATVRFGGIKGGVNGLLEGKDVYYSR